MNEQLQQALTAILNKTMSGVDAGVNFLSDEIPDVIYQLLLWKLFSNTLLALIGLGLLTATYLLLRKGFVNYGVESPKGYLEEKAGRYMTPFLAGGLSFIIGCTLAFTNGMEALKIWIAPKIYLIEYAASLVK